MQRYTIFFITVNAVRVSGAPDDGRRNRLKHVEH
jgi:hypothetical protein